MVGVFSREWNESRGDQYASWESSEWWFEVDDQGRAIRQMEMYAADPLKRYSESNPEDDAGGLTAEPFEETEWLPFQVEAATFNEVWRSRP